MEKHIILGNINFLKFELRFQEKTFFLGTILFLYNFIFGEPKQWNWF